MKRFVMGLVVLAMLAFGGCVTPAPLDVTNPVAVSAAADQVAAASEIAVSVAASKMRPEQVLELATVITAVTKAVAFDATRAESLDVLVTVALDAYVADPRNRGIYRAALNAVIATVKAYLVVPAQHRENAAAVYAYLTTARILVLAAMDGAIRGLRPYLPDVPAAAGKEIA